jgi:hypothetical protein
MKEGSTRNEHHTKEDLIITVTPNFTQNSTLSMVSQLRLILLL